MRLAFRMHIGSFYSAEQLVFVDDTGSACDHRTYVRDQALSVKGTRACLKHISYGERGEFTIILAGC